MSITEKLKKFIAGERATYISFNQAELMGCSGVCVTEAYKINDLVFIEVLFDSGPNKKIWGVRKVINVDNLAVDEASVIV